jgi:hypothetical protein
MIYDEKDQMEKDRIFWKFRLRVKSHVIPSQHHEESDGQLNIVFSSSISVADAIRAASELKADLKFSEVETSIVDVPDMQEDHMLHDAHFGHSNTFPGFIV